MRLFLPETWTNNPDRMRRAGVPEACQAERSKPEIALADLKRALNAGVRFRAVVADAGYGISAPCSMDVVGRRSDRQQLADRLDPVDPPGARR